MGGRRMMAHSPVHLADHDDELAVVQGAAAVHVVHLHRHLSDLAPVVRAQPVQHAQLVAWGCRQRRRAAAVRSIFTQALPLSPLGPP